MTSSPFFINARTVGAHGSTVVFLHGLFGQGRNFTQIAKGLEPDHRSILVDLPNHGRSEWTEEFDYVAMADLVADFLREDAAAEGPVHIVGHSMGGKVAMTLALRNPELVERLVVVDISPVSAVRSMGTFDHLLGSLARLDLDRLEGRSDADAKLRDDIPEDGTRGFLLQNLHSVDGAYRWRANLDLLHSSLPAIGAFPDFDGAQFDGPVLWVAGETSQYIKDEHRESMTSLFPRTRQLTVKGAGHWVHADQPEVFVSALRRFLG